MTPTDSVRFDPWVQQRIKHLKTPALAAPSPDSRPPEPTSWGIVALRVVSALFLAAYGLRLCEAYYLHIGFWPLLPYTSAWVSWICLARWQWHPVDWRKYHP